MRACHKVHRFEGAFGASLALLVCACGHGSEGSSQDEAGAGDGGPPTESVAVASLLGAVVRGCPVGLAHPTVCCTGGPSQATSCIMTPSDPFRKCAATAYPFPDPAMCCQLDDLSTCSPTPANAVVVDAGTSCASPCPPGSYPGPPPELCEVGGGTSCCTGGPGVATCNEYTCPGGGGSSPCGTCPDGWALGNPLDLCCRTSGTHDECFSLLNAIPGITITSGCSEGGPDCTCYEYDTRGNIYDYHCQHANCTCSINGKLSKTLDVPEECAVQIPGACSFPPVPF